jgi:Golgi apparatus protein 1
MQHLERNMTMNYRFIILCVLLLSMQPKAFADICLLDSDCQNGGSCESDLVGTDHAEVTSQCVCAPGFWGENCEKNCPILCENGGQCKLASDEHGGLHTSSDFVCDCPSGFSRPLCSESASEIDELQATQAPSSSMSAEAMAGLAIGLLAGLSLLVVGLVWVYRKSKAKSSEIELPPDLNEATTPDDAEIT